MELPDTVAWIGSAIACWAAVWAVLQQVLPRQYSAYISHRLFNAFSPYTYHEVLEVEGEGVNELYNCVKRYLSILTSDGARRSRLFIPKKSKDVQFSLARGDYVYDMYAGVKLRWEHKFMERKSNTFSFRERESDEIRQFELKLPRRNKGKFLAAYMSMIVEKAREMDRKNRELRLYSNKKDDPYRRPGGCWNHIPFRHPATFDTIAMEHGLKETIVNDLEEFLDGKEFYRRVGKAWKRGYLLYGPPGTGKTSIVAAMANKLQYDIYDLELTEVATNSQLREMLVYTQSKSIIVIEDIDCSLDLGKRKKAPKKQDNDSAPPIPKPEEDTASKVTLSGLLNFTDGLWSACEDERIFVFTTNFVNKLDPALLRSGRMDMHIHLSYCTFDAVKMLASSFFQIKEHALYAQVEELLNEGSRIVPSEAAELMMRNRRNADNALEKLVELLRERIADPPPPEPKPEDHDKVDETVEDGVEKPNDKD